MPAALLARFGRATAEQGVQHIEERMAPPRQRGFRARFAGREFQPGSEREFALGLLSSFAPMGTGLGGAAPMAMGAGASAPIWSSSTCEDWPGGARPTALARVHPGTEWGHADTGGFTDHVFATCPFLGYAFVPRIRELPLEAPLRGPDRPELGGNIPRQKELAAALREVGRIERVLKRAINFRRTRRTAGPKREPTSATALSRPLVADRLPPGTELACGARWSRGR